MAFKVRYPTDNFEEGVEVVPLPPPCNVPDLMLLKGSRSAMRLGATDLANTASVYAFGYTGAENKPSCSKGSLSSSMPGAVAIAAHADDGSSGGPVVLVDKHGSSRRQGLDALRHTTRKPRESLCDIRSLFF